MGPEWVEEDWRRGRQEDPLGDDLPLGDDFEWWVQVERGNPCSVIVPFCYRMPLLMTYKIQAYLLKAFVKTNTDL